MKRASYADLVALPDNVVGEIVDGALYASPRPAPGHALAKSVLGAELGAPFHLRRGGPGGWWILFEPELHLGEDVLVPDLAGWRKERMPEMPDEAAFRIPPDWVCEVLSPSTAKLDLALKLPRYAEAGCAFAWIVSPATRHLEVFDLQGGVPKLIAAHSAEDRFRAPPFTEVELELGPLWGGEPAT
jgi:Uma2 family endonuclease